MATSVRLAEMGASLVMVCRDRRRGEAALDRVRGRVGGGSVELMLVDLASLDSVRAFAREYEKSHDSLHVLVNNAGLARVRRSSTADGFETTFQVNYLSHFLLTNLLLPLLKRGAPSRVVSVSSVSHFGGHIDLGDLKVPKRYGVMNAYSRSKLAQVLFTYELSRRLQGTGVTANCLHPGAVATNIWRNYLGPLSFVGGLSRLFLKSADDGSKTSVYLAASPEVEGVTGKYYDRMRETRSSAESYDEALARKLWDESAAMVGLDGST